MTTNSAYDNYLANLSNEERQMVMQILNEYQTTGNSSTYTDLVNADYKEVPVDIITFLSNPNYLGNAWTNAAGKSSLYPFWKEQLQQLFPTSYDTSVNNFIESGARGLGKSEIAVACGLYLMYRVLCLKNPLEYYGLKPTEKICFAFMNITKVLAEDIGISKFQHTVQMSPWFMSKGTLTQKDNNPYWVPPEPIAIIIGSQAGHVIGQPIFYCLDGDTVICTDTGYRPIRELEGKTIQVPTINSDGKLEMSDQCTVAVTGYYQDVYEIELEDGSVVKCTPNHRFMLKDGTYKEAQNLTLDDELFSITKLNINGCMKIKSIKHVQLDTPQPFYDVINANPYNNFLIATNSGSICSHNCFFDEISFIRNKDIDKQKKIAIDMIDTAIGGMKTRFIKNGKNPTLLILASSKRSEKSFLEEHMKKKLKSEGTNVIIVDEAVWKVKPPGTYSSKTFYVGLGNKFLQSQVIPEDADLNEWRLKGFKIIEVPMDLYSNFSDDIERALCDYAGVSSSEITKYISGAAVREIINNNYKNPFLRDIAEIGNAEDDKVQYYDLFDMSGVTPFLKSRPLFIHMDMSVSGDMTGIAGVWIVGKKPSVDELSQANDLQFQLAFSISIKAPKGHQISFEKNRNFIYWLKEQGFRIKGITTDTFQSYDTGQALTAKGYPYEILSVDRVDPASHICKPYQYFRTSIYEKRLSIYESTTLIDEIIDLERNINTGKVDHPDGGRKDVCDAVCGATFNASRHAEEYAYDYGEDWNETMSMNLASTSVDMSQQIITDFENELKNMHNPLSGVEVQQSAAPVPTDRVAQLAYASQGILVL